ncbi:hypothetical protein L7F22_050045 [Adiantum nelumboides]|nr:hypothetical protein [Adiantum nelumboides]
MLVADEPNLIDQEYGDDTLLFLHYSHDVLDTIRYALEVYCVASGARINWDKSYGILARSDDVPTWGPSDFTWLRPSGTCGYLGFQVGLDVSPEQQFSRVMQSMRRKLCYWSSQHLSMADRALMANQVLLASAWYVASCWTLHGRVMLLLRRLIRNFLFGGSDGTHDTRARVHWSTFIMATSQGGLGIIDLEMQSRVLLTKLNVRELFPGNEPWKMLLHSGLATVSPTYGVREGHIWIPGMRRVSLAGELEKLQQDGDIPPDFLQNDGCTTNSVSFGANPDARQVRAELLKSMLDSCSNALVSMASELSEAEDRERVCSGPGRWQNLRTMGDAKALLNYVFNNAVDTRCQLWDLHRENKELKESIGKLKELLKQSEAHRREVHRQQQLAEHAIAKAITTSTQIGAERSGVRGIKEMSLRFLHTRTLDSQECFHSYNQSDMLSISSGGSQYGFRKINSRGARAKHSNPQMGKLLRWKRSHERWLLQFKWKWQKPWRLSEWIRHGDESLTRARPSRMLPAPEFQQS